MDEGEEHDIELVEAGKHAPEAFEAAKEPLDLVATVVGDAVVLPRLYPVGVGRPYGRKSNASAKRRVSLPS